MPKKYAETAKPFQITLTQSLHEQLEQLAQLGIYGSQLNDVIEELLNQEVRRLIASGELSRLLERIKIYPAKDRPGADQQE